MKLPTRDHAPQLVVEQLANLMEVELRTVEVRNAIVAGVEVLTLRAAGFVFALAWSSEGSVASIESAAARALAQAQAAGPRVIPLVAAPFIGVGARERCQAAGVAWLDLSGNAGMKAPGLRILVDGVPNRFRRRGRPSSAFAPKAARIARWLLIHHGDGLTQREVARATGMDEGYTSRVVGRLEQDNLIERSADGALHVRDPQLLLDAWVEAYDFGRHDIRRGHIAARSADALVQRMTSALDGAGVAYAATALAAAWQMTHFAGFRLVTMYLEEPPTDVLLRELGFRDESAGGNVWLVVPDDRGVFDGASTIEGLRCVHPVQVYLDLLAHPERAREAAERLRADRLRWGTNG